MRVPATLRERIRRVRGKRPRTVLQHILKHGHITTQELKDIYGYNHPPRAARDVREQGIALETFRVIGTDGRRIAAYRLADLEARPRAGYHGRKTFSKALKEELLKRHGNRCGVCGVQMESRYLQIDHRIPYDVAGDRGDPESRPRDFMLLCGPCNRAKSWSCEHCSNRLAGKRSRTCGSCYWASPERFTHVATLAHRRVELVWVGDSVDCYDALARAAAERGTSVNELLHRIVKAAVKSL